MKKIKIHIRNNHWKEGFLPCDEEGEKHSTITKEEFEKGLMLYPEIRNKIEYLIDWDEDNYLSSMKNKDILLGWQFPTQNITEIAPNLKWIHVSSAGVNHLLPFNWMKDNLVLTNSSGVHTKKAGEFGLMSILMLQNQLAKIVTNQKNKEFVTLLSKPIEGYKVIVVGTGLAGASACATLGELGYNVDAFSFHESPRRAHSIAAQGGINAAKNYRNDGDSIYRLFYDTVKENQKQKIIILTKH